MNEQEVVESIIELLMNRVESELDEAYKLPETDEDRDQYYYVADVLEDIVAHIHIFYSHPSRTLKEAMTKAVAEVETWDEKKRDSLSLIYEARQKARHGD